MYDRALAGKLFSFFLSFDAMRVSAISPNPVPLHVFAEEERAEHFFAGFA
jgi:hypothetical protein